MNKNILSALVVSVLSSGAAQASVTINAVHDTAESPNSIESYFFKANSGGSSDIYLSSTGIVTSLSPAEVFANGLLSVWTQSGNNWVLVGANDEAPRQPSNSINTYGVNVHQWEAFDPMGGISDPGLTLNLTAGADYLVIQSDTNNGPKSLSNEFHLTGALGQTIAIGSPLQAALWGTYAPFGAPISGVQLNNYSLTITGDVTQTTGPGSPPPAVPLPAAVWLFGSAMAGLGVIGRKKAERQLLA